MKKKFYMALALSGLLLLPSLVLAAIDPETQAQLKRLEKMVTIQTSAIKILESHQVVMASTTNRPGQYNTPEVTIVPRSGGAGAAEMPKFGDTVIKINQARRVFVTATITFRPGAYASSALGAAITAKKGAQIIVLHDAQNPLKSLNRGSGDGPYFKPSADAYSTIPVSGVLEIPEAGDWTLQILIENSGTENVSVHTYSLTGIAI